MSWDELPEEDDDMLLRGWLIEQGIDPDSDHDYVLRWYGPMYYVQHKDDPPRSFGFSQPKP